MKEKLCCKVLGRNRVPFNTTSIIGIVNLEALCKQEQLAVEQSAKGCDAGGGWMQPAWQQHQHAGAMRTAQ
jgi:hypothetical protein